MVATAQKSIYDEVIDVTTEFLGPAAERFIQRQIATHVDKPPQKITAGDVEKLVDWVSIAVALLTEDSKTVDAFTGKLREISKRK